MNKKFTLLLICFLTSIIANAQVLIDETFNYSVTNLSSETTWTTSGTLTTGAGRTIITPALTYAEPGGSAWALSGQGKAVNVDVSSSTTYVAVKPFSTTPVNSGSVYLSMLFNPGLAQSQSQVVILGLASGTSQGAMVWVGKGAVTTTNFRFGVTTGNTTSTNIKWGSTEFSDISATYLIVLKHEFSTNTSTVYINPTIGSSAEPSTFEAQEATPAYSGFVNRTSLNNMWFRCTGSSVSRFNIGGVRVSTSWTKAVEALTALTPLTAPTVGVATNITLNGFTANWTKVTNAVSYDISVYQGATLISTTNATSQETESKEITGLLTGTSYTYTVIAKGDGISYGNSVPSTASASFTTLGLSVPVVGVASDITASGFTANWTAVANALSYDLLVYQGSTLIKTSNASGQATQNIAITGLSMGTSYTYKVIAKGDGTSTFDSSPSLESAVVITTSLAVNAINTNFGDGSWGTPLSAVVSGSFPSSSINGFVLEKAAVKTGTKTDPKGEIHTNEIIIDKNSVFGKITFPTVNSFEQIEVHAYTGTAERSFMLKEYNTGTSTWDVIGTYTYNTASKNSGNDSIYLVSLSRTVPTQLRIENNGSGSMSVTKIVTRTTNPITLSAPILGTATAINGTGFTANWTPVANATGYKVFVYATNGTSTSLRNSYSVSGQASQSLVIADLDTAKICTYKVSAIGDGGVAYLDSYLSLASASFEIARLATPVVGTASDITTSGFTANWTPVPSASSYDVSVYQGTTLISTNTASGQATSSIAITGLAPSTTYIYTVVAKGDGTTTFNSKESAASISFTTADLTSPVLSSPTVSLVTTTSATLGGTVTATGMTALVERGTAWSTLPYPSENTLAEGGTVVGAFTHLRTGMTPNTLYFFRAYATNSNGTGYSADGTFTTLPLAPIVANATNILISGFTANWTAPSGQGTASFTYTLEVSTDNSFATNLTTINGINSSNLTKAVTGLNYATTYYYRVKAVNAEGNSVFSDIATATTAYVASLPTATLVTTTGATLGGTINTVNGGATVIDRGTVYGTSSSPTDNALVEGGTGTGVFSHARTGLLPNTLYYYRAFATYASGRGYSIDGTFTTVSLAPKTLAASNVSQTGFTMNWEAPASQGNATYTYSLDVSRDNTFTTGVFSISNLNSSTLSYVITGANSLSNYYYRVRINNASGNSVYSNITTVTTLSTGISNTTLGNSSYSFYPNPASNSLNFEYSLLESTNVQLVIYNLIGQEIRTLINNESQSVGEYSKYYDVSDLNSGIYLARFTTGKYSKSFKIQISK